MAQVFGRSQAWESLRATLGGDAQRIETPAQLAAEVEARRAARAGWPERARELVLEGLRQHAAHFHKMEGALAADRARIEAESAAERDAILARVESLMYGYGLLRGLLHRVFRIPRLRRDAEALRHKPEQDLAARSLHLPRLKAEQAEREANAQADAEAHVRRWEAELRRLETAVASTEFPGALAELELAAHLVAGLPEAFLVFADVNVDLGRSVTIIRGYRRKAQIDLVVVGPTGLYVVEVKRWSGRFAREGRSQNPFDQLREASTLLYIALQERLGYEIRTHDVIATDGELPPRPPGNRAWVLIPAAVCGHVLRGTAKLSAQQVTEAAEVLRRWTTR